MENNIYNDGAWDGMNNNTSGFGYFPPADSNNGPNAPPPLVQIYGLSKRYGSFTALSGVSLSLPRGKIIGLLGPNGSGKTTLIKLLTNLLMQYDGSILIDGKKPGKETKGFVSYLPDRNYLPDKWSTKNAISYFADFYPDFNVGKAWQLMGKLHIDTEKRFKTLSKGTKEKVQLALVLSREAQLYLFDEPIAGVDPATRDYIFQMIFDNCSPNASIIISTHLVSEAENIFDYAVFLKQGRIAIAGGANEIREHHGKSLNDLFREVFRYV